MESKVKKVMYILSSIYYSLLILRLYEIFQYDEELLFLVIANASLMCNITISAFIKIMSQKLYGIFHSL